MRLSITDLTHEAKGVGRSDGQVIFVEGALPGDEVDARVVRRKKRYAEAEMTGIHTASPDRIQPPCPYFPECGGCDLQHYAYQAGLEWKRRRIRTLFEKAGFGLEVKPVIGMETPWGYRNHMQLQVKHGTMGFFRRGSHDIVPIRRCLIQSGAANRILSALRKYPLPEGLKRILVRTSGERVMVAFDGAVPPGDFAPLFREGVVSVWAKEGAWRKIAGEDTLSISLFGLRFAVRPDTFFQVNTQMARDLFAHAIRAMELRCDRTYMDLYCGIGPLGMLAAKESGSVTGIEIASESVRMAIETASREGIENIRFLCAPSEQAAENRLRSDPPDGVFVDPPRAGLDSRLVEALNHSTVQRLVYISCDPATLARDAARFRDAGWEGSYVQPFDLFPWTVHVESMLVLERRNGKEQDL